MTTDGGAEHIERLSRKYQRHGLPFWYGGREQVRVILTIEPAKIHSMRWAVPPE
jgi:hypothetical protein